MLSAVFCSDKICGALPQLVLARGVVLIRWVVVDTGGRYVGKNKKLVKITNITLGWRRQHSSPPAVQPRAVAGKARSRDPNTIYGENDVTLLLYTEKARKPPGQGFNIACGDTLSAVYGFKFALERITSSFSGIFSSFNYPFNR